jgi:hypothetical protein
MKKWPIYCAALLASATLTSSLWAQVPAAPAAAGAAVAPAAAPGAATAAGGAATQGFPFCQKFAAQCKICSAWFCQTPLGQLANNAMMPMSAMSGGLLTSCCPTTPSASDLAAVADDPGPMGAAAAVAMDEAGAKKRKAAVRYLSTADCHWWPEVEKALIIALRTDRNECVRLEAAIGLGKGCCCTRRVIEALAICVEASSRDGNPSENSERVRACALAALNHCLCCYRSPPEPFQGEDKEKAPPPSAQRLQPQPLPAGVQASLAAFNGSAGLSPYYAMVETKPMAVVVARARKVAEAASGSGPLAPKPTETCFRDVLFPWMASSDTTVTTRTVSDSQVVQTAGTVVEPSATMGQVSGNMPAGNMVQTSGTVSPASSVIIQAPTTMVQPSSAMPVQMATPEMQMETVPVQERPRIFPRRWTWGNTNATAQPEVVPATVPMTVPTSVPNPSEPEMFQPVPMQPSSEAPTPTTSQAPGRKMLDRMANLVRREPRSESAATSTVVSVETESAPVVSMPLISTPVVSTSVVSAPVVSAPVVSAPVASAPVSAPVVSHAVAVESNNKPASTGIVQAGHFESTTSNVDGTDMMQGPMQNTITHTQTPVPITDLLGPNSSAILRGEPVVEKKTVTAPATLPAPIITTPAAAASLTPPTPPQMLPPPAAPKMLPAPVAAPQTLPAPVTSTPIPRTVIASSTAAPVTTPVAYTTPVATTPGVATQVTTPAPTPAPANGFLSRFSRNSEPDTGKNEMSRLLHVVQSDGNPAARRQAISQLESQNLQSSREAMPVLLNGACGDSDADVRVRCLRCLLKLNPSEAQLKTVVDRLKGDTDEEVQFQLYLVRQRLEKPAQANKTNKG